MLAASPPVGLLAAAAWQKHVSGIAAYVVEYGAAVWQVAQDAWSWATTRSLLWQPELTHAVSVVLDESGTIAKCANEPALPWAAFMAAVAVVWQSVQLIATPFPPSATGRPLWMTAADVGSVFQ